MTSTQLTIRSEADILALVPVTLGFHPEDSLVLVTLGSARVSGPFSARVDLPDDPEHLQPVVDLLVRAATRNNARRAFVVGYSDDECVTASAVLRLGDALEDAGIEPLSLLRADGTCWHRLDPDTGEEGPGVPYDVRSHVLTSRSVLDGRVTLRSRDELADSLSTFDPDVVEAVATAHAALDPLDPRDRTVLLLEVEWLAAQLRAHRKRLPSWEPLVVARLLRAVANADVRDQAWCGMPRKEAARHVAFWQEVVRRSPADLVAPAAGVLAFASWLNGNGALAWCAVERGLQADPDHSLCRLVSDMLTDAIPPSTWTPIPPGRLGLSAG